MARGTRRDEPRDAARAVAALLDLGAVGIEDSVVDVRAGATWRFEDQRLVEPDAGAPVRQAAQSGGRGHLLGAAGVEDDEVVAESMHLREGEAHAPKDIRRSMPLRAHFRETRRDPGFDARVARNHAEQLAHARGVDAARLDEVLEHPLD